MTSSDNQQEPTNPDHPTTRSKGGRRRVIVILVTGTVIGTVIGLINGEWVPWTALGLAAAAAFAFMTRGR